MVSFTIRFLSGIAIGLLLAQSLLPSFSSVSKEELFISKTSRYYKEYENIAPEIEWTIISRLHHRLETAVYQLEGFYSKSKRLPTSNKELDCKKSNCKPEFFYKDGRYIFHIGGSFKGREIGTIKWQELLVVEPFFIGNKLRFKCQMSYFPADEGLLKGRRQCGIDTKIKQLYQRSENTF